jgi:threonine synthase
MNFIETRGNDNNNKLYVTFSEAILKPSASFNGLYVPQNIPIIDDTFITDNSNSTYKQLALNILKKFDLDISIQWIEESLDLYDNFSHKQVVPLKKLDKNLFANELYHGPTKAFKDMALQPFGYILSKLAKQNKQNYLIIAATSGDTGPAALHTFKNKSNIKIVCLYPKDGTSDVQRLQMITQGAKNTKIIGVNGDFDDTQNALKDLLADKDFNQKLENKDTLLSAANSVNFGRIIFQIIYHFQGYINLIKQKEIKNKESIYLIIPSGNFGNALGAYYAKLMGLPIKKILISSNSNSVLEELINNGIYDICDRKIVKTSSPAMDILKSSNVERILFHKFGNKRTKELMDKLDKYGKYELTKDETLSIQEDFGAISCDDRYVNDKIRYYYKDKGYLMDTHTATSIKAYEELAKGDTKTIICSTAQWTKFSPTILNAINNSNDDINDQVALDKIAKDMEIKIPIEIKELFDKKIVQNLVVDIDNIKNEILKFI